jgi:peroxiredoxin
MASIEVGKSAPHVTLTGMDRKPVSLSDFKGKKVVVAFFPAAYTGVCTKEMCTFRDSMANFNSINAQVLGVSVDPPFSQKAWSDANKLTFPLLSDYNREAVRAFDVEAKDFLGMKGYSAAKRSVFVIDSHGIVRYKWVSDNPGVEPNYDEVAKAAQAAS